MQTLRQEVYIPISGVFNFYFVIRDSDGNPLDFTGRSATVKLKNIHEEAEESEIHTCANDCIEIEPEDSENNKIKGKIQFNIKKEDTSKLTIPKSESDPYGISGFHSVIQVDFDNGEIPIILKVRPIKTI